MWIRTLARFSQELLSDPVYWVGTDGRFEFANSPACRLLGYSLKKLRAMAVSDISPHLAARLSSFPAGESAGAGPIRFETILRARDGRDVPVRVIAGNFTDRDKTICCLQVRDLTERQRTRDKMVRLAAFPHHNPNPVLEYDGKGTLTFANPAAHNLLRDFPSTNHLPEELQKAIQLSLASRQRVQNVEAKLGDRTLLWMVAPVPAADRVAVYGTDISEHVAAQEALHRWEERFLKAFQSSSDAITISTLSEGRMLDVNDAFLQMAGYDREEIQGRRSLDLGIWADEKTRQEIVAEIQRTGRIAPREVAFRTKAGEPRAILFSADRIVVDGEECILGIGKDITDRKKAEEALRLAQFSIERSPDAAFWVSHEGRFLYVNAAACGMLGYTREELLGMGVPDVDIPFSTRNWPDEWNKLKQAGVSLLQSILRAKDGRTFPVEISTNYLNFQGKEMIFAFVRDITERKRSEEALRASEERYREWIENANDVIYTHDLKGNFTSLNRAGEAISGYTREEALAMNMRDILLPGDLSLAQQMIEQKLAGKGPTTYELEIRAKDGRHVALEVSTRVLTQDGKPAGIQGIARDITERRQLEEQLRQAQKMEAVGRLAGGVAHDFNNLLNVILGYSEMLISRTDPASTQHRNAEEIHKAAERASSLTNQLLTFSRRQTARPAVLNLNEIVRDMDSMLRRLIGEDVELVTKTDPALGSTKADPNQIEQILLNLAVNARDAMPRGGRLTLETANVDFADGSGRPQAELSAGQYILLRVSDTGTGIEPEILPRIFEPFFTTKDKNEGTGLGLGVVYGIVKQNGGAIIVSSEKGRGTTFDIYLPRVKDPHERRPIIKLREDAPKGKETILLVEDEHSLRALLRDFLVRQQYQVLEAADGPQALEVSARTRGPIDLLLTDLVMPQMSGREVARQLQGSRPAMRIVYMSGYENFIEAGSNGDRKAGETFLQKPFSLESLAGKVREALDGVPATRRSH